MCLSTRFFKKEDGMVRTMMWTATRRCRVNDLSAWAVEFCHLFFLSLFPVKTGSRAYRDK